MHQYLGRCWVNIDLDCLTYNYRKIREILSPGCGMMAIIKADAYSHGDVRVAQHLVEQGVEWFGVTSIHEALSLRSHNIDRPILILTHTPVSHLELLGKHGLTQTVASLEYARQLQQAAADLQVSLPVHLKLDTGMARIGFDALQEENIESAVLEIEAVSKLPNLVLQGIATHFSSAGEPDADSAEYTRAQYARFEETLCRLERKGIHIPVRYCCNSAAAILYPEMHMDLARVGMILYGLYPGGSCIGKLDLKPVLSWYGMITAVKEIPAGQAVSYGRTYRSGEKRRIAIVSVGYADGIFRGLSNKGYLLVNGCKAPIIGNVCMDQLMVDVTEINTVEAGDTAVIIGKSGGEALSADAMAEALGTINYEVITRIGRRVSRVYILDGKETDVVEYLL